MKRIFRNVALSVAACSVTACADDSQPSAADTATPSDPSGFCAPVMERMESFLAGAAAEGASGDATRQGGTAVVSAGGALLGMNAFNAADYATVQHHTFVNLMTLVRLDEDLQPAPYLAASWEVAPDTSAVTFNLRDDVFWHDGVKTSAQDVAFTYERMTDPATGFPNPGYWDYYVQGAEGVEVVDSFTVRIRLARPHAEFLDPWRSAAIMPAHLLEDVPAAELGQHPIGTVCPVGNGPFVFVEHRPQESWTFRANPAFPGGLGGRPPLDRYVYRIVQEPTTALTDLLTERTDVYIAVAPSQAADIEASDQVELRAFPFRDYIFVGWNARREHLSDARVRRALTLGTNRREVVDALLEGYGRVADSSVPPFHWAYDESVEGAMEYDPERAGALLEEAGWIDRDGDGVRENAAGQPLAISIKYNAGNQSRKGVAEIMQAQLARIGVRVTPEVLEWATLLEQILGPSRDFDGVVMGFTADFRLDDRDLFHSERIEGPMAFMGVQDPELDRLLDTLQLVTNRDDARPLWAEYQRRLLAVHPATFFYFVQRLDGVNRRLNGVEMDLRGEWVSVRDWWIEPAERRDRAGG